jgi:predicted nuclease of predicted toxin-antitoxin system
MALLIDENISHRIVAKLIDYFPGTIHARQIDSSRLNDFKIFKFAQENNLIIVTRDEDFRHIHGAPPKIIWLRTANSSTLNILHKLVAKRDDIELLAREEETDLLEIY